ncbi:hypothetical protein BDN67DRAFT_881086, partial [Paxillus ammoniavirescens]
FEDILNGAEPMDISHTGGEFEELSRQVIDHTKLCLQAFETQMPVITQAYLAWSFAHGECSQKEFFEE